jgi:hypothetical protein
MVESWAKDPRVYVMRWDDPMLCAAKVSDLRVESDKRAQIVRRTLPAPIRRSPQGKLLRADNTNPVKQAYRIDADGNVSELKQQRR